MHTFFLPAAQWHEPYEITGAEVRHLRVVLRIRRGEHIRLLDGEGREGVFTVAETSGQRIALTPQKIITHKKPSSTVTLAVGYGRNIRRGWLLEKAVELEADGIWFWQAERSQGKVPGEGKETWTAQMVAGAKQSNNPYLPELRTLPGGAAQLAEAKNGFDAAFILWEGDTGGVFLSREDLTHPGRTLLVLGPEGGFTEREVNMLENAGFTPVSLGNRVLRWETAALLTLGLAWWSRQRQSAIVTP